HKEQPIVGHRVRKATLQGGQVYTIGAWQADHHFTVSHAWQGEKGDLIQPLLEVLKAVYDNATSDKQALVPSEVKALIERLSPSEASLNAAKAMIATQKVSVLLGQFALNHPQAATIHWLSRLIAQLVQGTWGEMSSGANSAGGWLAGAVPHRLPFGIKTANEGLDALQMLQQPRKTYVLLNCEPEYDLADPHLAIKALKQAETVVVLSAFDNPLYREYADVILPVTPVSEMAGTYVNALGEWQSFRAATTPLGQSRPAWKVLRVLGNLMHVPDFNYETIEEIGQELHTLASQAKLPEENVLAMPYPAAHSQTVNGLVRLAFTSLYAVDGITRRANALQETQDAKSSRFVRLHPTDAKQRNLREGQRIVVSENSQRSLPLTLQLDEGIPLGAASVASGIPETHALGTTLGNIEILPCEGQ
ncbi:MAG TPA: molybdopterin-dependent oxidoreductase, partial [Candidatus Berkiella sp.]|nr:molybdopterin-dependent oxidoreductase [Candidatus Berkiella sp.]